MYPPTRRSIMVENNVKWQNSAVARSENARICPQVAKVIPYCATGFLERRTISIMMAGIKGAVQKTSGMVRKSNNPWSATYNISPIKMAVLKVSKSFRCVKRQREISKSAEFLPIIWATYGSTTLFIFLGRRLVFNIRTISFDRCA